MEDLKRLSTETRVKSWDRQIRLFARYFLAHARLPSSGEFSLLDIGCGTGSGLAEIKAKRPAARLFGCDVDALHVRLARYLNGSCADFFQADIENVQGGFDYIYISNLLEHIEDWLPPFCRLCELADCVFVLVPYQEDLSKRVPSGVPHVDHLSSFNYNSFDFLLEQGFAVQKRVIRTPHAWGPPIHGELLSVVRSVLSARRPERRRELLVQVSRIDPRGRSTEARTRSFRSPALAFLASQTATRGLDRP